MSCTCGESNPDLMMNRGKGRKSKNLCKNCHNKNTGNRARANKALYVSYKGGICQRPGCGYSFCVEAMDFHHIDPSQKDPTFKSMRHWGFLKAKEELDKCLLLCARCHREKHAGLW